MNVLEWETAVVLESGSFRPAVRTKESVPVILPSLGTRDLEK